MWYSPGGDDTFIVGAWDAVFEFAHLLRENFKAFAAEMKPVIATELTFSAGLLLVDAKYPALRFAKLLMRRWMLLKTGLPKNLKTGFASSVRCFFGLSSASRRRIINRSTPANWHILWPR